MTGYGLIKMKKEIIISDKSNEIRKPAVASPSLGVECRDLLAHTER